MRVCIEGLVAPNQVAWVYYREGNAEVAIKIIKSPETGKLFASLPTAHKKGNTVQVVRYESKDEWLKIARQAVVFYEEVFSHASNQ